MTGRDSRVPRESCGRRPSRKKRSWLWSRLVPAAPFIQGTKARGVPPGRLLFRDALRAASNPLVSLLGLSIAGLLSTSLVIEALMSWPGLGPLLLDAIAARDLYLVIGAVMCSTVLLLAGNFVADALLYWTDPRLRVDHP